MTADETLDLPGFQYKHGDRPLEGYTIQRAAGRGGFGEVYYALSDSGREVALKLVHTYEQIELRGISQCMNLKSPQLVSIFDVKYGSDGRPWVIMEYVSGPSLRELLDASPSGLGPAKSAFFLREIAKGLSYLHDCGIVHRDLKPGNIFYENGYVKIGDYGLSKSISMTRHSGQTIAVGTLHYMAPEIGEGRYDRSIDIYALGALLYEMITGQVPFFGASPAEVLMKHLTADVSVDGIDEPFRTVIRKAMAKKPADRYQSVQEMVEAVFGSEEIRNSVSQFSPASLTMVAGRAARNIGGVVVAASRAGPAKINENFQRFEHLKTPSDSPNPNAPLGDVALSPGVDRMLPPTRYMLVALTIAIAVMLTSANVSQHHLGSYCSFVFLSILGALAGSFFSRRVVAQGMQGESPWVKRFVSGAPIAGWAALASLPSFIHADPTAHVANMLGATFSGLLLMSWDERIMPGRRERLSIVHVVMPWLAGMILASMFDAGRSPVVLALVGSSIAVSFFSPWVGPYDAALKAARGPRPLGPVPTAAPLVGGTPPPVRTPSPLPNSDQAQPKYPPTAAWPWETGWQQWQSKQYWKQQKEQWKQWKDQWRAHKRSNEVNPVAWHAPLIGAAVVAIVFITLIGNGHGPAVLIVPAIIFFILMRALNGSRGKGGTMSNNPTFSNSSSIVREAAFSVARGILSLFSGIILMIALVATLLVVMDAPTLAERGVFNANLPHQLDMMLNTPDWPRLASEAGVAIAAVGGVIGVGMMLLARRAGGAAHMLRGVLAMAILFAAVLALGQALPHAEDVVIGTSRSATWDWYYQHIESHRAIWAGIVYIVGTFLLSWPPRRERLTITTAPPATPAAPSPTPPPAPAAPDGR